MTQRAAARANEIRVLSSAVDGPSLWSGELQKAGVSKGKLISNPENPGSLATTAPHFRA
jgi:hypothetical protein